MPIADGLIALAIGLPPATGRRTFATLTTMENESECSWQVLTLRTAFGYVFAPNLKPPGSRSPSMHDF